MTSPGGPYQRCLSPPQWSPLTRSGMTFPEQMMGFAAFRQPQWSPLTRSGMTR